MSESPWVVIAAMVGGLSLFFGRRLWADRRERTVRRLADSYGLAFSAVDEHDILELEGFNLFGWSAGHGFENILRGEWNGRPITGFDFWYVTYADTSNGSARPTYHRFSCLLMALPADVPHTTIVPKSWTGGLTQRLRGSGITFELDAFNRMWTVDGVDRYAAMALADQRVIDFLIRVSSRFTIEVCGSALLAYSKLLRKSRLAGFYDAVVELVDLLPRSLSSLYPKSEPNDSG